MKQTLLRTCHSWIGPLLPVPGDASGVGGDTEVESYQHVCVHLAVKPDVSAILMMENVADNES